MNLAMPSCMYYSGGAEHDHKNPQGSSLPAHIQNLRFSETRHRVLWRPKCALSMLAITLSDKNVAHCVAVWSKDEKAT